MPCKYWFRLLTLAALLFVTFFGGPSAEAGIARLELYSDPGSYIGGGKDYFITDLEADAYNLYPSYNTADGDWTVVGFHIVESSTVYSYLSFSTHRLGHALQAGTYENAQRFPFEDQGRPGLSVAFWSQAGDVDAGSFTIAEITFYTDMNGEKQLGRFSATFDQVSEIGSSHVYGSLNYTAFAPVPEPSSIALIGTAAIFGLGLTRCRRVR